MAVAAELVEMMTDTIVIKNATSYSGLGYGLANRETGVSHRAFVQKSNRLVRTADGVMETSEFDAWTDSILTTLTSDDIIEFAGKTFKAISVDIFRDETGPHHTVIHMVGVVSP